MAQILDSSFPASVFTQDDFYANANGTWICVSVNGVGKRVVLPAGSPVGIPVGTLVDLVNGTLARVTIRPTCPTATNLLPGPHPLVQGAGYHADVYYDGSELELCFGGDGLGGHYEDGGIGYRLN